MHYNADILDDYLHGEFGPERDATIHAHLESCADCRAVYDEAASVRDWLQNAARAEELEFPSIIKARVWERVRELPVPVSFADRLRALWRPMIAVPVAAVLALFVYIGVPGIHGGSQSAGVAATYLLEEHAAVASENPLADRGLIVPASMVDDEQTSGLIDASDTAAASDR
jgi:predicted anti-sigma-YlaC factor YlaD